MLPKRALPELSFYILIIILHSVVAKLLASKVASSCTDRQCIQLWIKWGKTLLVRWQVSLVLPKICITSIRSHCPNNYGTAPSGTVSGTQQSHTSPLDTTPGTTYLIVLYCVMLFLWKSRSISSFSSIIRNGQYQEYWYTSRRWLKTHPNWPYLGPNSNNNCQTNTCGNSSFLVCCQYWGWSFWWAKC